MSEYLTPEQEQAEEDAATAAAETRYEEARQRWREALYETLRATHPTDGSVTMQAVEAYALANWIDELTAAHRAQQDRITALLTAVDYLRPPF